MTWFRKLRSAIQIALVISIFWATVLVLFRAGVGFSFDALTVAEFTDWFGSQIVEILATGFLLGLLFAAGLVFSRHPQRAQPLTRGRSIRLGALGGFLLSLATLTYYGFSPYVTFFWEAVVPVLAVTTIGAFTGFLVWRTTRHAELGAGDTQLEKLNP